MAVASAPVPSRAVAPEARPLMDIPHKLLPLTSRVLRRLLGRLPARLPGRLPTPLPTLPLEPLPPPLPEPPLAISMDAWSIGLPAGKLVKRERQHCWMQIAAASAMGLTGT